MQDHVEAALAALRSKGALNSWDRNFLQWISETESPTVKQLAVLKILVAKAGWNPPEPLGFERRTRRSGSRR